jgi:hypothetical protein
VAGIDELHLEAVFALWEVLGEFQIMEVPPIGRQAIGYQDTLAVKWVSPTGWPFLGRRHGVVAVADILPFITQVALES